MSDEGDPLATRDAERRGVYRRRLAAAAVASVALHMILARGLAVSHLGSPLPTPSDTAGKERLTPKRKPADFTLRISPSHQQRPAHERPLDLAARPSAKRPVERLPEQPRRDDRAPRPPAAVEPEETPRVALAELPRTPPLKATNEPAAPARQATAQASSPGATAADTSAIDAARSAAPAAALAAATLTARSEPSAAPVASRWRPREVELLERLAARPAATARANRAPADDTPEAAVADRRSSIDTRTMSATADTIAVPAAATPRTAAAAPAAVASSRLATAPRGVASASAGDAAPEAVEQPLRATASLTAPARMARPGGAASVAPLRPGVSASASTASVSTAGIGVASAAAATGSAGPAASALATASRGGRPTGGEPGRAAAAAARSGSATADATASSGEGGAAAAAAGSGWVASRSSSRAGEGGRAGGGDGGVATTLGRTSTTASGGGDGKADMIATSGGPTGSSGASTGTTTAGGLDDASGDDVGTAAARPGPAALGRLGSAGAGGATGRSALGSSRSGSASDDGESEGLSVSLAAAGSGLSAAGRRRGAGDDPGLPQRIAAAALPAEGRVRDVAEAFARRTAGGSGAARAEKVADHDVAQQAKTLVDRGLEFLVRSQQADGRWRLGAFSGSTAADMPKLESDTAATGLALLCFLGAGHDHFAGPHRDTVRRGLEFLLAIQKPDGDLFLPADDLSNSCAWLYSHGIASIAVCEAVGMTGDPLVKPAAEKACRFIAASQHPQLGGWRYTPRSDADLSVSGWMLVAVRAGELAGVKTDPATLPGVRRLLEAAAARGDATRYAYNPRKQDQRRSRLSTACMTAVGGLMRLHTGDRASDPSVAAAARVLAALEPSYGSGTEKARDSYLWYYASQVLVHTGGADWNRWYGQLVHVLADHQESAGPKAGSWDPILPVPDRWGEYGGRVYVTALHLLALEMPDRHLPTSTASPP
ncbi:MAG: hypothetical protein K8S94_01005 [Planctomycetia bacterium]|nr:hypothetical protein [Planctomycetia bacterium]